MVETRALDQVSRLTAVSPEALILISEPGGIEGTIDLRTLFGKYIATDTATATVADLNARLDYADKSIGLVFADPDILANGWYRKVGVAGTGGWQQFETLSKATRETLLTLSGHGPPSTSIGTTGQFYRDLTNGTEYGPKTDGLWGAPRSIIGPAGTADNTYTPGNGGLDALSASDVTRGTASLVLNPGVPDGRFNWTLGDFRQLALSNPKDCIKSMTIPLNEGAWLRQKADGTLVDGVKPASVQARFEDLEIVVPMSPTNDPTENTAALKAVLAYAPAGKMIVLPRGDFTYDTGGGATGRGFNEAPVVRQRQDIRVDGRHRMNSGGRMLNPPTFLRIEADFCAISGNGTLQGDGSFDSVNDSSLDGANFPRLIDVTSAHVTIRDVHFVDVPKVGVFGRRANNLKVIGVDVIGGPQTYSDTSHFGFRFSGGASPLLSNIRFLPSAPGGKVVSGVFAVGCNGVQMLSCEAKPWEKLAYLFGDDHVIDGFVIADALLTDAIRVEGDRPRIRNGSLRNVKGAITIYNSTGARISNVDATEVHQNGISIQAKSGFAGSLSNHRISNSSFEADTSSNMSAYGLDVYAPDAINIQDIELANVAVRNFGAAFGPGFGGVRIMQAGTGAATGVAINGLRVSNSPHALILRRANGAVVRDLMPDSLSQVPIILSDGSNRKIEGVRGQGSISMLGISGFDPATDTARDNRWTADKLEIGVTILSGTSSFTAALPSWVANNAHLGAPVPSNAAARASNRAVFASRSSDNFTIGRGDGTSTTADEQYVIPVVQ